MSIKINENIQKIVPLHTKTGLEALIWKKDLAIMIRQTEKSTKTQTQLKCILHFIRFKKIIRTSKFFRHFAVTHSDTNDQYAHFQSLKLFLLLTPLDSPRFYLLTGKENTYIFSSSQKFGIFIPNGFNIVWKTGLP